MSVPSGGVHYCRALAARFDEVAEANGECVALRWSPGVGFRLVLPDPRRGEVRAAEVRVPEVRALAELAAMLVADDREVVARAEAGAAMVAAGRLVRFRAAVLPAGHPGRAEALAAAGAVEAAGAAVAAEASR